MARISTGNFGFDAPQVPSPADTTPVGRGLENLASGAEALAHRYSEDAINRARAAAAQAYLDHQLATKTAAQDITDQLATGQLAPEAAPQAYQKATSAIPQPKIGGLPVTEHENFDRQLQRTVFAGAIDVRKAAEVADKVRFKADFSAGLDKLGKLAGMPGANIDTINQQAGMFAQTGMQAGIPKDQVDKAIQDFKDKNWQNHATQRAMESADDLHALQALQHDLTAADGYYAGKLDTDKRNAVLRSVLNDKAQLEARLEHQADRREARAAVAMNEIGRQISSGVPATAPMWASWADEVKGTSQAEAFTDAVANEGHVQEVLSQPARDQVAYVQATEAKLLSGGGSLREKANFDRLREAVIKNVSVLHEAPLLYNANRTGQNVVPLDLASLLDPNSTQVAAQLRDRTVTLDAMRKADPSVRVLPLLPQETQVLAGTLNAATPVQATQLFGALRTAAGSDPTYLAIMQQVAPDSPVKAVAGMLAAQQRSLTLERNWFSSDVVANSVDVSKTILKGDSIVNPSKEDAATNGHPKLALYLPPGAVTELQAKFNAVVGAAFADRAPAAETAFQAVQAYYVGDAVEHGRLAADAKDVKSADVRHAVQAVIGEMVDYHQRGEVLAPWGMDAATFEDRAQAALRAALPQLPPHQIELLGLMNRDDTTYYVSDGRGPLSGKDGKPIVIDVGGLEGAGGGF
jgi:hypothetical protein